MTPELYGKLKDKGYDTFGKIAFAAASSPQALTDEAIDVWLATVVDPRPSAFQVSVIRRLLFESQSLNIADLRTRVEGQPENTIKKLPTAERIARQEAQQARLKGVVFTVSNQPSHASIDQVTDMLENNSLRYLPMNRWTSRSQELSLAKKDSSIQIDAEGNLKLGTKVPDPVCDTNGAYALRQAFFRRSLALDLGNLCTFEVMEEWVNTIFELTQRQVPTGYTKVSLSQIVAADKELFIRAANNLEGKLQKPVGATKPLDAELKRLSVSHDITQFLSPLLTPPPPAHPTKRPQDGDDDAPPKKTKGRGDKGNKGGGKGKTPRIEIPEGCSVKLLAKSLEEEETKLHASFPPWFEKVVKGKRICLWESLLKNHGFDDMGVVDLMKKGVTDNFIEGPYTEAQVTEIFGHSDWGIIPRFVLEQGLEKKIRPIDDGHASQVNEAFTSLIKLELQGADFVAGLALLISQAEKERSERLGVAARKWVGRTLDLSKAYKQLGVLPQHRDIAVICHPNENGEPQFFIANALMFGLTSSVYGFVRVARSLHFLLAKVLKIPSANYFDDYPLFTLRDGAHELDGLTSEFLELLGWRFAQTGVKGQPYEEAFTVLGMQLDISRLHEGAAVLANKEGRVKRISEMLGSIFDKGALGRHEAQVLLGLLNYASGFFAGRSLKPACHFLLSLVRGKRQTAAEIKRFCKTTQAVLSTTPPRVLRIFDPRPPIHVWTDGAWEDPWAGIGAVVLDTLDDSARVFAGCVPAKLLERWKLDVGSQLICEIELYALVTLRRMLQNSLCNRRVIFWLDNEAARTSAIKGLSQSESMYRLAHYLAVIEAEAYVRILRELRSDHGGRMATAIGDINVEAADTEIGHRQLAEGNEPVNNSGEPTRETEAPPPQPTTAHEDVALEVPPTPAASVEPVSEQPAPPLTPEQQARLQASRAAAMERRAVNLSGQASAADDVPHAAESQTPTDTSDQPGISGENQLLCSSDALFGDLGLDFDAGGSSDEEDPGSADRDLMPVGRRRNLRFIGKCLGHDVSWRGTQVIRIVSLQAGGVGGSDREAWGQWWADCAAELGADIFVLAETRITTARGHTQAVSGISKGGYFGISHNMDPTAHTSSRAPSPMSSGIIIAVRKDYVGHWQHVTKDSDGRAQFGTLLKDDGAAIGVVGVYGPTGATSASFDQDASALAQERRLVEFVSNQKANALHTNTSLLVVGDTNSYTSPDLDCWDCQATVRPTCLAIQLQEMGLHDCFRELHPRLRVFTYYTRQGTASRLDQIWFMGGIGGASQVLNAAVVWQWHKRTDHDPVVVDLSHVLPTSDEPPTATNEMDWRRIVQASLSTLEADALRAEIRTPLELERAPLEEAMTQIRQQAADLRSTPTTMATVFEPGGIAAGTQISDQRAVVKRLWEKSEQYASKLLTGAGRTDDRPFIEDWDGFRSQPQECLRIGMTPELYGKLKDKGYDTFGKIAFAAASSPQALTDEAIDVTDNFIEGPYTEAQVTEIFGHSDWGIIPRFVLEQGLEKKIRPIDDGHASQVNEAFTSLIKLELQGADFVAGLALLISQAEKERSERLGVAARKWVGRTLDLSKAYKQLGVLPQHRDIAVICHPNENGEPQFFIANALMFGLTSSVYGFVRVARSLHFLLAKVLKIPSANYFDDYPLFTLRDGAHELDGLTSEFLELLGWRFAQTGVKGQPYEEAFTVLGMQLDISRLHEGAAVLANKEGRVKRISEMLGSIFDKGALGRHEAQVLLGLLNYASGFFAGRSLKPACHFLLSLVRGKRQTAAEIKRFCKTTQAVLSTTPPRVLRIFDPRPPIHVWTDGAWEDPWAGIGAVVLDTLDDSARVFAGCVPAKLLERWKLDVGSQLICEIELYALVTLRRMLQNSLCNRRVIFWLDNEAARTSAIKGLSQSESMYRLAHYLAVIEAEAPCIAWYERVPSFSNIADPPSRGEGHSILSLVGAKVVEAFIHDESSNQRFLHQGFA
ncbi:unnamed protein product [Symbiodinium sp. CCMP2592]|nr:unnamed protein product [Symbiodinium sp. CCMP2592]